MSVTSNVSYSGLNNQNAQSLKDIQRAESAVRSYYKSLGGETERTSHWHVDDEGNVSHFAYVRREDKLKKNFVKKRKKMRRRELRGQERKLELIISRMFLCLL